MSLCIGTYCYGKCNGGVSLWIFSRSLEQLRVAGAAQPATPSTCKAFNIDVADPHLDTGSDHEGVQRNR